MPRALDIGTFRKPPLILPSRKMKVLSISDEKACSTSFLSHPYLQRINTSFPKLENHPNAITPFLSVVSPSWNLFSFHSSLYHFFFGVVFIPIKMGLTDSSRIR